METREESVKSETPPRETLKIRPKMQNLRALQGKHTSTRALRAARAVLCGLFAAGGAATAGGAVDPVADSIAGYFHYNYRLYVPPSASPTHPLPLWVALHGRGESGTDNLDHVTTHVQNLLDASQEGSSPFILLAPQSQDDWVNPMNLKDLIERIASEYPVDRARIYISGLSRGGYGTYEAVADVPEMYAAAVTLSGWHSPGVAAALAPVPFWLIHGTGDPTVPLTDSTGMVALMEAAGGQPRLTEVPGWGHCCWNNVYGDDPAYTGFFTGGDPARTMTGLYAWMFSHALASVPTLTAPVVGDRFLIDFGEFRQASGPTEEGAFWNDLWEVEGATQTGLAWQALRTSTGKRTSAKVELVDAFTGMDGVGTQSSRFYPKTAQRDSWWVGVPGDPVAAAATQATLRLSGLPAGVPLRLTAFGSTAPGLSGTTTVLSVGALSDTYTASGNQNAVAVLEEVYAEIDGSLLVVLQVADDGVSDRAFLGVLEIELGRTVEAEVIERGPSQVEISFLGKKGWPHRLESSLDNLTWGPTGEPVINGAGFDTRVSWLVSAAVSRFWRVVELVP